MDFSKIKPEFRKEVVREGTVHLDGLLRIATSADARASGLAGIFTATATALAAGIVITVFNASGQPLHAKVPLLLGGSISALLCLAAAVLCIVALQPVNFYLPGVPPADWDTDITGGRDLDECLGERAGHIQTQIDANIRTIEGNARRFRWGSRLGIAAPFAGVLVWLLASTCRLAA